MISLSKDNYTEPFGKNEKQLLYLYTPMCGTCQIASTMLRVVEQMTSLPVYQLDLNYVPDLAETYGVESVPCLLSLEGGQVKYKRYAFDTVPTLLEEIRTFEQK
ncbi:thioredoxin family protein [Bacillus fonticola]|uniref:thioredoxin family protein n=1 Tax=Bacillus fonticola TaxID=2728853 RepID=UPI00147460D9|nr:thioredoxin family protein [Bacillus fonticola]